MAWYDFILDATDRIATAASKTLLAASEAIAPPPEGVTRKELRAERKASRKRMREPANKKILREQAKRRRERRRQQRRQPAREPAPRSEPRPPRPEPLEPGKEFILLEGDIALVKMEYERSAWSSEAEAYEAFRTLEDAGLAQSGYLAMAFWPRRRRLPYVIYVGPSPA